MDFLVNIRRKDIQEMWRYDVSLERWWNRTAIGDSNDTEDAN